LILLFLSSWINYVTSVILWGAFPGYKRITKENIIVSKERKTLWVIKKQEFEIFAGRRLGFFSFESMILGLNGKRLESL
jgi:hypothetical protein